MYSLMDLFDLVGWFWFCIGLIWWSIATKEVLWFLSTKKINVFWCSWLLVDYAFLTLFWCSIIVFGTGVGIPIGSTLYVLCNLGEEDSGHLFFTCEVSMSLWNRCGGWIGVQFVHD